MPRRALSIAVALVALSLARSTPVRAEEGEGHGLEVWFIGPAREISHSSSASRDTALLRMLLAPRPVLAGGGDFGLLALRASGLTWRLGFFGMLELESKETTKAFVGTPQGDINFWRGLWGYSIACSLDRLAETWLGSGSALEATLSFRHESEHYTGSNEGDAGTDYSDRPHIGNFLMPDLAVRWRVGAVSLTARYQHKIFLPDGFYTHGPGGDLGVRWHLWKYLHPFLSVFGEYVFGAHDSEIGRVPDNYLVRGHLGVVVPSTYGDLYVFLSGDVGHRKGLAAFTEEATIGAGIQIAFF